jgi:cell division protein FtsZ
MEASALIQEKAHDDANIIIGALFDESLGEELRVTVIATGISSIEEPEVSQLEVVRNASGPSVDGYKPVTVAAILEEEAISPDAPRSASPSPISCPRGCRACPSRSSTTTNTTSMTSRPICARRQTDGGGRR